MTRKQESRSPKLSLTLTALKKLKMPKDAELDQNVAKLLKPLKKLRVEKSRSPTPQRVFHCSPKLSRSPKPDLFRKERPSDSRVESGSIRVQKKQLTFAKLKPKPKKKESPHHEVLSPHFKRHIPLMPVLSESKHKKSLKGKKKKKVASEKNESSTKEENTLQLSDMKRLKEASLSLRDKINRSVLKTAGKRAQKQEFVAKQGTLMKKKKSLNISLFDILETSAILIQKHVRGYLCRQRLGRFLQSFLQSAQSEGVLDENNYSDNLTPLPSRGVPVKPLTSNHSQSSSLINGWKHRTEGKDRSLKEISIGHWQRYDLKTEYSDPSGSQTDPKVREIVVKRPTRTIDVGIQSEPIEPTKVYSIVSQPSKPEVEKVSLKTVSIAKDQLPLKTFAAVGCQVSFRNVDKSPVKPTVTVCSPIILEKEYPTKIVAPSSSRANLEKLAKDEYKKWSQVDQLLAKLNQSQGQGRPKDINEIFGKIEAIANQSKFSLKNKFDVQSSSQTLLSLSKTPTVQSVQQGADHSKVAESRGDMPRRNVAITKSIASSPISSPLASKVKNISIEKWPKVPDIQKSITLHEGKSADHPLFESIDEKLDRIIQREQRGVSSSLKWSSRIDMDQSESVMRSVISERDTISRDDGKNSMKTLEHVSSKDSFVGPAGKIGGLQLPLMNFTENNFYGNAPLRSNTPIPTECSDLSPYENSTSHQPILLKSRSKKAVLDIRGTIQTIPCPPEDEECHLEKASLFQETPRKSSTSLQEINLALQTILDDLGDDMTPMNDILNDSTKRIDSSQMWNIDSPQSSARKSAKDQTMGMLVDMVLDAIVEETAAENLWRSILTRKRPAQSPKSKESLSEKFKQIDELLNYDDKPVSTSPKQVAEKARSPKVESNSFKPAHFPENILDDNIEEDMENSGEAQSEAETVYGIRTNFNAVNEYLNLLLKFLRERLPELGLPISKHSRSLVLKRIHNLEHELKENAAQAISVKSIEIPRRPNKKDRTAVNCFARPEPQSAMLPAYLFTALEEDILVISHLQSHLTRT